MRDFDPTASEYISSGYVDRSRPNGSIHYDPTSIFSAVAPSLIGGLMGGDAAGRASDQQAASGREANAMIAAQQARTEAALKPWVSTGGKANNALAVRLGLSGAKGSVPGVGSPEYDQAYQANLRQFISSGGNLSDPNAERYLQNDTQLSLQNGTASGSYGGAQAEGFGSLLKQFDQSDLSKDLVYQNGLQFGIDTGVNQINDRAAAGGNYGSGAALKALTRFGNDYATTKTAGAYDRNMGEKNQTFNFLSNQSAQGQNAAAGVGASGASATNQMAGNVTGMGNAQAAGTVGAANAINGGIGGATDAYRWNQLLNKRGGSSSYNPTTHGMGFDRYLSGNLGSGD